MKRKVLSFLLIITSLIGYLEWSTTSRSFLFQVEWEVIRKFFISPSDIIHPFILAPIAGQICLLITLFQKNPNRFLLLIGMLCLGILMIFMFLVGCMSKNWWIVLSTLPFLVTTFLTIKELNRKNNISVTEEET